MASDAELAQSTLRTQSGGIATALGRRSRVSPDATDRRNGRNEATRYMP